MSGTIPDFDQKIKLAAMPDKKYIRKDGDANSNRAPKETGRTAKTSSRQVLIPVFIPEMLVDDNLLDNGEDGRYQPI